MAQKSSTPIAQNPLLLRLYRLMDAFIKSDDERDFYLDRTEGFIIYHDLDKPAEDLEKLHGELKISPDRYCLLPKLTFYEIKKIMEGFVNEKVYDIDTKEKLLDIIQSKDAREHFLEFIYDHESELEKWQQYYQERSRVRIIEWLRNQNFQFVFEEDLDLPRALVEKIKLSLFETKAPKDVSQARQALSLKAKTYYSNEALNPRPKRGRPPKQVAKVEVEAEISGDIFTTVPPVARRFLYIPEIQNASSITFSEKFDTEEEFLAHLRGPKGAMEETSLRALSEKFAALRNLSQRLSSIEESGVAIPEKISFDEDEDEEEEDENDIPLPQSAKKAASKKAPPKAPKKESKSTKPSKPLPKKK